MFFETTLTAERIATLTAGGFYTDRLRELMFTSGTTGEPKGVITANTISAGFDPIIRTLGMSSDDVCHMAVPPARARRGRRSRSLFRKRVLTGCEDLCGLHIL
jgi:hypothetical protein